MFNKFLFLTCVSLLIYPQFLLNKFTTIEKYKTNREKTITEYKTSYLLPLAVAENINSADKSNSLDVITVPSYDTVVIEISYNSGKSDFISKDILNNSLREITTSFIGSGYKYTKNSEADLVIKAYLDAEVSAYEHQGSTIYDFLSKITLRAFDKNNKLLKESNKNIFLSGNKLEDISLDSARKASSLAAQDIIIQLGSYKKKKAINTSLSKKIEVTFLGNNNYKSFNTINKILENSPFEIKLLKRSFEINNSFSIIILSRVESKELAEYIQTKLPENILVESIEFTENKIMFELDAN
jgi:hypothetical protein